MKTYLISIEENNSPRLLKTLSQPFFKNGELPVMKLGVKGGELNAKEYFELGVKGRSKPLSPSMVGCTLSHLEALKEFLKTDDQYALILEDDAIIPDDLTIDKLSAEVCNFQNPLNTLFSIGGIQMKECRKVRGKILSKEFLKRKVIKVSPDFYHRICFAVAYIVDREMAKTLLAYHSPLRAADDWRYLTDFSPSASIIMTSLIDHPIVIKGEKDNLVSSIENERNQSADVPISKYGTKIRYNMAKYINKKYPK